MLTTIHRELSEYVSGLGLPVFPADCVPDDAALPYLTLAIEAPLTAAHSGRAVLTLWCQSSSAHADRLTHGDQLLTLIPPRGVWLDTGYETLLPTPEKPAQPLREKTALGLRTSWKLQRYPHV